MGKNKKKISLYFVLEKKINKLNSLFISCEAFSRHYSKYFINNADEMRLKKLMPIDFEQLNKEYNDVKNSLCNIIKDINLKTSNLNDRNMYQEKINARLEALEVFYRFNKSIMLSELENLNFSMNTNENIYD